MLSLKRPARSTGIPAAELAAKLDGKISFDVDQLGAIASALDVAVETFLDDPRTRHRVKTKWGDVFAVNWGLGTMVATAGNMGIVESDGLTHLLGVDPLRPSIAVAAIINAALQVSLADAFLAGAPPVRTCDHCPVRVAVAAIAAAQATRPRSVSQERDGARRPALKPRGDEACRSNDGHHLCW